MFARVITAQTGEAGSDAAIRLASQRLPDARQRPGFAGYSLLVDDASGKVIIILMWETREDMKAVTRGTADGIHNDGLAETGLDSTRLETFAVAVHA
jgi:heme-degrading monooxygenase HmoA